MARGLRVRNATPEDEEALYAVARAAIRKAYSYFLSPAEVAEYLASGTPEMYIQDNLKRTMVLEADNSVCGFAICLGNRLELIMIDPGRQGSGMGTFLLQKAENVIFALYPEMHLDSFAGNSRANRFYRRHGYKVTKRFKDKKTHQPMVRFTKIHPDKKR